jgi:hypothetical protein
VAVVLLAHVVIIAFFLIERQELRTVQAEPTSNLIILEQPASQTQPAQPLSLAPEKLPRLRAAPGPTTITLPSFSIAQPQPTEPVPFGSCPPFPPNGSPAPGCPVLIIPGGLYWDETGQIAQRKLPVERQTPGQIEDEHKATLARLRRKFEPESKAPPPDWGNDTTPEIGTDAWQGPQKWEQEYTSEKAPLVKRAEDAVLPP